MARIRTVKPGLFKNEHLAELPMTARYMFIGLFCLADKEGRMEDRPKRIKAEIFPYDNIDVDDQLSRLQSAGFINRYGVGEMKVIQVVNFTKHQVIRGSEALTESSYPPKGNHEETIRKPLGSQEGKGKEGNKERKGEADEPPSRPKENKIFVKPDRESVTNYFEEIGLSQFEAEAQGAKFFDYYEANGWKIGGKTKMKDWEATVRMWKSRMNDFKNEKNGTTHQQTSTGNRKDAGARKVINLLHTELESDARSARDSKR